MKIWWDELTWDLKALALLVSPSKKFRKMMAIEKNLKKLKIVLKLKGIKVTWFKSLDIHYSKHWKEFYWVNSKSEYQRKAIDFLKNREWKDIKVWTRKWTNNNPWDWAIFKADMKTWTIVNIHKDWKIWTFHKSNDFLKNPENYINKNN
jgi:hypothetical protein